MAIQLDALGETGPFEGFVEADFDAFERKKWSSRVYTLERRAARQKIVTLLREAMAAMPEAFASLELGASDDAPSMANQRKVDSVWAFLTRPESVRMALASRLAKNDLADAASLFDIAIEHQHASLLLVVRQEGFRVELHLSPKARVDRMNVARKLAYAEDRSSLVEMFSGLSAGAQAGFPDTLVDAHSVDEQVFESWTPRWESDREPFVVRVDIERDNETLASPDFVQTLQSDLQSLAAVYNHLAWSRDNDFAKIGVGQAIEKAEKKISKSKKAAAAAPGSLEPGARVTILSGLFAGRSGYLAEQEGKGKVKVMVGPVSVSVPISDIKAQ